MDQPPIQPTCCAGLQAIGTLLGTMFGFMSAALLTPIHGGHGRFGMPAVPGVVIGSSLGVLAAHSAGEGSQPLRQVVSLLVLSLAAASAMTIASNWLLGDFLRQGGTIGIIALATIASLGTTAVFTMHDYHRWLRAAAMGEDRSVLQKLRDEDEEMTDPKEV